LLRTDPGRFEERRARRDLGVAATGAAGGPTNPRPPNAGASSPSAQLGYFQRLEGSRWLLGGKRTYNYIAATATDHFVAMPQSASFALVGGGSSTSFTFNVGAAYFLTSSWFVDVGYAFTLTDLWNSTYASSFTNDTGAFQTAGILSGSSTGGLNTHALTVSINRRF